MNGFKIYKSEDAVEVYNNKAGIFRLLLQDDDWEFFESTVNPGKSIICQPYESKNSINIMFVLSGKMFHTNEKKMIQSGDRVTFKNLDITHHISVLEKTELLMFRNCKHFIEQASTTHVVCDLIHQIQEKDHYTEDHCNNTGNLAVQIGTFMKLPEFTINNLLHAGKIHDVGKINIPIEILNKPAPLSVEEYEIIKRHSIDGHDIVLKTTGNKELAKIVLDHHERLDGSGYPNGLCSDEISIESKIMAVVDSYDAMISKRPYKEAIGVQDALDDLKRHSGTWYDEQVILALCEIISFTS